MLLRPKCLASCFLKKCHKKFTSDASFVEKIENVNEEISNIKSMDFGRLKLLIITYSYFKRIVGCLTNESKGGTDDSYSS